MHTNTYIHTRIHTLHYTTLRYTTLHCTALHYTACKHTFIHAYIHTYISTTKWHDLPHTLSPVSQSSVTQLLSFSVVARCQRHGVENWPAPNALVTHAPVCVNTHSYLPAGLHQTRELAYTKRAVDPCASVRQHSAIFFNGSYNARG